MTVTPADIELIARQLGRRPRGVRSVAFRCPCGLPCVIETQPRLDDGRPFPTLYYLTCPKVVAAVGTLEAGGRMKRMTQRLAADPELRAAYHAAHRDYLRRRDAAARSAGVEPLPPGTQSAGGMPERVKCLHALVAHQLAVAGLNRPAEPAAESAEPALAVNPFGREALTDVGEWWRDGPCVRP